MKRVVSLVLVLFCLCCLIGCTPKGQVFQAEVLEVSSGSIMVKPLAGYPEANGADRISVRIPSGADSPSLTVGDIVEITYSGVMLTSYPPILGDVKKIVVVKTK